jgi:cysteine desulfurase/selenocysteine lyase
MTESIPLGRELRSQFPIFRHNMRQDGRRLLPLSYLDSAATAQKPQHVIDAITHFLERDYGTVHRGAYELSVRSSDLYERAREKVKSLFGQGAMDTEVVFTRGATEGLNILANGIAESFLDENSRIVSTVAEHHANMIPWQQMALRKNCELAYIPLVGKQGSDLRLNLDQAKRLISSNTRVVSFAHVGNVLGQENPVAELVALAKSVGAVVVLDCAQSISSFDTDVFALGVDAVVLSAHKMYGPSGIGAVVARKKLLRDLPPLLFGGGMISSVTLEESTWTDAPAKFEAGTPPLMEVAGLVACIDWLQRVDRKRIHAHAASLASEFAAGLAKINGIQVFSPGTGNETVVSFRHESVHAHDMATILDSENVAVRAGHHCAWPLVRFLGVDALVRASFAAYSDTDDVEAALRGVQKAVSLF